MENREKILDKIKKLLKLQDSAESLGNEARRMPLLMQFTDCLQPII